MFRSWCLRFLSIQMYGILWNRKIVFYLESPLRMIKSEAEAIANCFKKLIFKPRKQRCLKGVCG